MTQSDMAQAMDEAYSDYFGIAYRFEVGEVSSTVQGEYIDEPGGCLHRRDLDNSYTMDDYNENIDGCGAVEEHDRSRILSGALWDFTTDVASGVQEAAEITLGSLQYLDGDPSFLDARNALITAAGDAGHSGYTCDIKHAFAARGIGSECPPPAPTVNIASGPVRVTEDQQATWTASISGGSGSYSVSWYIRSSSSDPFYGTCAGATTSCTTSFPDDPNATTDYGAIRIFAIDDVYGTYDSDQWTVIVYEDGDYDGGGGDPPPPPDDCNVVTTSEPGINAPPPPPLPCYSALVAGQSVQPVPEAFALEGNYPNPFTRRTRIEFALPETAKVTLVVYDMMGRQVATLVDESMKAGFHDVPFEAQGLPSGVYLYRFRAGEKFADTGRMVVVR